MNDKLLTRIFAGVSFFFSLAIYLMTVAPTVSFWDCGEFIACSYKLAVPHPPGAPLYLLVGRFFTLIPEALIENIALRVNLISVFSSAFTVLFLHMSILHLVREYYTDSDGFHKYVPHLGALIGALTYAFSNSFWFNAVEAEVYAPSMLFTGIVVWLAFRWSERHEEIGNERYLLLIAYVMGLALGVHLLNVLAIPMIVMIVYYRRFKLMTQTFIIANVVGVVVMGIVYPGVVKFIPKLATTGIGFGGIFALILLLLFAFVQFLKSGRRIASISLLAMLLIVIGYSSYATIFIRSNLDPNIDENNPETIEAFISYLEREQYGDHDPLDRAGTWESSPNGRNYDSAWDFFWTYQINHMYNRYFFWNFIGMEEGERPDWKFSILGILTFFIGITGAYYHFVRDRKHGYAVLLLFFWTGLAIILYLNQPDPQPRERDYSYVASFFAFAIWVGIGAAGILEAIANWAKSGEGTSRQAIGWVVAIALIAALPVRIMTENFERHNRTGNYVAWDYSYNMLISCEPNATLYTNGDNDTFPLWYLQEVEKVRPDVRVANLSLLNTPWYIEQIKNKPPQTPISLTDNQIDNLNEHMHRHGVQLFGNKYPAYGRLPATGLFPWPEEDEVVIKIDEDIRQAEEERYRLSLEGQNDRAVENEVRFNLRSKYSVPIGAGQRLGFLRVQDYMILNSLLTNKFEKPQYFAVTTSNKNQLDGLRNYLRMDGLVFKITTIPNWTTDADVLYDNLMNKFRFRGLDDPDVYFNPNIMGLLQNYRSAFFKLANTYLDMDDRDKFNEIIRRCNEVMPPDVIPYNNQQFGSVMTLFAYMAGVDSTVNFASPDYAIRDLQIIGDMALSFEEFDIAIDAYEPMVARLDAGISGSEAEEFLRAALRRADFYDQLDANRRAAMIDQLSTQTKEQLVRSYIGAQRFDTAMEFLESWKTEDPNNRFIQSQLESIKSMMEADE